MKTFEQLAEAAYDAFCKAHDPRDHADRPLNTLGWAHLPANARAAWTAAAKQVAAEIAALH